MLDFLRKTLFPENENQTLPPGVFAPALAARLITLFHGHRIEHLTSIPFDLAQRGYLYIAQEESDVLFIRTEKSAETLAHLFDRLFLVDMFGAKQQMPFKELGPRLHHMRWSLNNYIDQELTQLTTSSKASWRGFRSYLKREGAADDAEEFGRYLAYAIAFGVGIEWGTRFIELSKVALPSWYSTLEPANMLVELLRIAHIMSEQLQTKDISSGITIPYDKQLAAGTQHPLGQSVTVIVTPAH